MKYQELFPIPVEWISEVDESMASTVEQWAQQEVISRRLEHKEDYDQLLEPAMKKLFVDIGLQAMLWPEERGGGGHNSRDALMTAAAVAELAGFADTGIAFVLANTLALQSTFAVEPNSNGELIEDFAPLFCGDEPAIGSLVLLDYGRGVSGDVPTLDGLYYQVQARKRGEDLVLTGEKVRPQCCGKNASLFGFVFQSAEDTPALAVADADSKGIERSEVIKKTGLSPSVQADLSLSELQIPGSLVALEGIDRLREMLSVYYMACSAACSGAMLACYEIIREWVNTRVIKGKGQVFKENPLVASLIGEIGGNIAVVRILTYNLARMLSSPRCYGRPGSESLFATATAVLKRVAGLSMISINNIMELMGSAGYSTEWNLERYWRDVKTLEATVVGETVARVDMARRYFDLQVL